MLARQEVETLNAEVAKLRVELAEARAATTMANLRAELAQAHRDLEHLARVHLTTIAFYAAEDHYPISLRRTVARGHVSSSVYCWLSR